MYSEDRDVTSSPKMSCNFCRMTHWFISQWMIQSGLKYTEAENTSVKFLLAKAAMKLCTCLLESNAPTSCEVCPVIRARVSPTCFNPSLSFYNRDVEREYIGLISDTVKFTKAQRTPYATNGVT